MEIHFLRPYWLLAIIPVLFLCWQLSKIKLTDNWRKICDAHLLSHLLTTTTRTVNLALFILTLGCVLAIVALAGPSWEKATQPIYRAMAARVITLNLSPAMNDPIRTASKSTLARFKILDFLEREKEGFTGLVVYSNEAYTISPLTEDNHTIANFVPALDPSIMPTFDDDTSVGLSEAGKLLKQAGFRNGSIILITDKVTNLSKAQKTAAALSLEGYKLFILSLSQKSSDNQELQLLAKSGGGSVIPLTPGNQDIESLIRKTHVGWLPLTKKTKEEGKFWQDDGRSLVFLILPLAVLAFRKGYL